MPDDSLKAKNEAMKARFTKWISDHPGARFSEAKASFRASLTEDDRDFLLEHYLTTDAEAIRILKGT